ncbi:MAG: 3-deoxy-D-manno-octulosonate 8-phosphate phosphatase [Ginsengibacter sp.]
MNILYRFKLIKTFVFDIDGVLTDGKLLILKDGEMARQMNIKDGYALQLAIKKGYRIAVVSGGNSEALKERLYKLKITDVFMQVENKQELLRDYVRRNNLSWNEILFMGDDIPDYKCMELAALACCPADAVVEIKRLSKYISAYKGGEGCARDVIEKVLKLNGNWDLDIEPPAV